MKYIVRSRDAGVFHAEVEEWDPATQVAVLTDARRIWYWDGAASLSELALKGPSRPQNCKFPAAVPVVTVTGIIELIPASEEASAAIESVAVWSEH